LTVEVGSVDPPLLVALGALPLLTVVLLLLRSGPPLLPLPPLPPPPLMLLLLQLQLMWILVAWSNVAGDVVRAGTRPPAHHGTPGGAPSSASDRGRARCGLWEKVLRILHPTTFVSVQRRLAPAREVADRKRSMIGGKEREVGRMVVVGIVRQQGERGQENDSNMSMKIQKFTFERR
jgi:hypothetical protein